MNDDVLQAHSLAEVRLFLRGTKCPDCGHGPLLGGPDASTQASDPFDVTGECGACRHRHGFRFVVPHGETVDESSHLYAVVNPTDEPSRILDVGQWIMLFRVVLEAAGKESRKIEARRLGYEAAQCLEEAMKFYGDDDQPPDSAVFTEQTRSHRHDHPEQYSRRRLINMRGKLPKLAVMQGQGGAAADGSGKPWWRFWTRRR